MKMNDQNEFVQNFDIEKADNLPTPKKTKSKKRWLIIGFTVVICTIVTISILYIKNKLTPSERLLAGYRNLFKDSDLLSEELDI